MAVVGNNTINHDDDDNVTTTMTTIVMMNTLTNAADTRNFNAFSGRCNLQLMRTINSDILYTLDSFVASSFVASSFPLSPEVGSSSGDAMYPGFVIPSDVIMNTAGGSLLVSESQETSSLGDPVLFELGLCTSLAGSLVSGTILLDRTLEASRDFAKPLYGATLFGLIAGAVFALG